MTAEAAPRHTLAVDVGDGMRLAVQRAGSGPPVILLHGFTGSAATWDGLTAALCGRYTTLAVDLPGHGRSSAPDEPGRYALERLADDLAALLDAVEFPRAAVLGYSLGARAALRFALRYPDRVTALVLESGSPGLSDAAARSARAAADGALADAIERDGVEAFVDRWERLPLWASQEALPAATRAELRAQRLTNDPRGLANSLRGAGAGVTAPVVDELGRQSAPALLVAGALDARYVELARRMAAALPRARLAVVPDAGHAVHLERPAAFATAVSAFLDGLRSGHGERA